MPPDLRKWYFSINDLGFEESWPLLQVAVRSCLAATRLRPHCLYNGENDAYIQRLEGLGAHVIRHRSSLEAVLRRGYGAQYDKFSGHWLRVDIPQIEAEDPFVLYTDIDVLFRAHPEIKRPPRYLAAAPERYRWRYPHFNSGVMVLNLNNLRQISAEFHAAITRRMEAGWRPPGHDQVSYNAVFRWRHARLPHAMNWKPYWGVNPKASIVHFHGPKPVHIARLKAGAVADMLPVYKTLWHWNPQAYDRYCKEFQGFTGSD